MFADAGNLRFSDGATLNNNGSFEILNGTLNIILEGGFQPELGESFQILTFGSRAGTFSTVNGLVIGNGNKFDVSYGTLNVTLHVVADN